MIEKKLTQLAEGQPPKNYKNAAHALEPLRGRLLELHRKGWSSGQLAEELKGAGAPVSPARLEAILNLRHGLIAPWKQCLSTTRIESRLFSA